MQLDLTSTPEDLIARDAAAAEQQILQEDEAAFIRAESTKVIAPGSFTLDYSPLETLMATSAATSPLERKRMRNLKLESPLTPQNSEESPPKKAKRVTFPADIASLVPQHSTDSSAVGVEEARDELSACVEQIVTPFAVSVMHEALNEELVETDTTMRVRVPSISAVKIQAPWDQYRSVSTTMPELQSQRTFLRYTREEILRGEQRWSGVSKLEKLLPWKPFPPYLGKVDLKEQFDDGSLARYIQELDIEDEVDLHALIGKRERLKILDLGESDGDDDEIVPTPMAAGEEGPVTDQMVPDRSNPQKLRNAPSNGDTRATALPVSGVPDMLTLLRKKKQELANSAVRSASKSQTHTSNAVGAAPAGPKPLPDINIMHGNGLSNFLHLQGRNLSHLGSDGRQLANMVASVAPPAVMVSHQSKPPEELVQLPAPQLSTSKHARIPLVVSAVFTGNRGMLRALQGALPNAEFVERATLETLEHGKKMSHPEADLTLSPSTGLITTTLQKLKQRPLPGQANFTGIRDHIVAVSARLERMIVLVSEGSTASADSDMDVKPMDDRDCEALADLNAFATALQAEVQVLYIAGGDNEMVKWIAVAATTHGIIDGSGSLLQEETLWERFLRKAGLNTYAAQAILNRLRESPAGSQYSGSSSFINSSPSTGRHGLPAFVMMSANDRIREFGDLLGGERVLQRVNAVLESSWHHEIDDASKR